MGTRGPRGPKNSSSDNPDLEEQFVQFQLHHLELRNTDIPHICHGLTDGVRGEKICHVEKFQIPVHDRCGEV